MEVEETFLWNGVSRVMRNGWTCVLVVLCDRLLFPPNKSCFPWARVLFFVQSILANNACVGTTGLYKIVTPVCSRHV
jgi:hypothetical protein